MPVEALDAATIVGKGYCADVHAWGPGRVLKLFQSWVPRDRVEREYNATRAVHTSGLSVPAVYELVEVEGRFGIVFERIDGVSLLDYTHKKPWKLVGAIRQLAELQAEIHGRRAPDGVPTLRQRIRARIEATDLPPAEKQAALDGLAALPDGTSLCHGDFHPGNIMITSRGPVVIDWSSASAGHPLGDVACTSRLLRNAKLPPWSPGYMHLMLKCFRMAMHRAYLRHSLRLHPSGTREQITAWEAPLAVAARYWRLPGAVD